VEYKNEMLDTLVGKPVVVGLVKAPDLDKDSVESMREDPTFGMTEVVQSVRASFELVGYDGSCVTEDARGRGTSVLGPLERGAQDRGWLRGPHRFHRPISLFTRVHRIPLLRTSSVGGPPKELANVSRGPGGYNARGWTFQVGARYARTGNRFASYVPQGRSALDTT
jgi:hypothetical protein